MYIETSRMMIRPFQMDDAAGLHAILGDDLTMKNCEPAYSFEKTTQFLSEFCIARNGALAAIHRESSMLVGYILFKEMEEGVYEMGWIFHRSCWRQGYAYEACSAVIRHAFEALGAHKLMAEAIDSIKSVGLMEKLGMRREGIQRSHTRDNNGQWCDLYLNGILREEWQLTACK